MKRFILSDGATSDLDDIVVYLDSLPLEPGFRIGLTLQETLYDLVEHPMHGHLHEDYSALAGEEIRRFVSDAYVVFYSPSRQVFLFIGVLHEKRDIDTIMRQRLS